MESRCFTAKEAKGLLEFSWPDDCGISGLPPDVQEAARDLYLNIQDAVEELEEEVFADDDNDPGMIDLISEYLALLPQVPLQPPPSIRS